MAVTFTVTPSKVFSVGDRKCVIADVACTGTPTAGGDDLTGAALGLDLTVNAILPSNAVKSDGTIGAVVSAIPGTSKATIVFLVQGMAGATNTMVPLTSTTANLSFRVVAFGKGKAAKV